MQLVIQTSMGGPWFLHKIQGRVVVLSDNLEKLTFSFALLSAAIPLWVAAGTLPPHGKEEGG